MGSRCFIKGGTFSKDKRLVFSLAAFHECSLKIGRHPAEDAFNTTL